LVSTAACESTVMFARATVEGQRPLVLVVDDQPFFRAYLREELSRLGHVVVSVGNAAAAMRVVEELGPPMVIILDLMLPGTNGPELLHALADRPDASALRFILVSAHSIVEKVAPYHKLVLGRFEKPVDLGHLTECLQNAGVALCAYG
jgi:CheY-like chemotaxis protein